MAEAKRKLVNYYENIKDLQLHQISTEIQEACFYAQRENNDDMPFFIYHKLNEDSEAGKLRIYCRSEYPEGHISFHCFETNAALDFIQNTDCSYDLIFQYFLDDGVDDSDQYTFEYHCDNNHRYQEHQCDR